MSQLSAAQTSNNPSLMYEVQVGNITEKHATSDFNLPAYVRERKLADSSYQYTCGAFNTYEGANNYRLILNSFGICDAVVVAFAADKQISIEEAAIYKQSLTERLANSEE